MAAATQSSTRTTKASLIARVALPLFLYATIVSAQHHVADSNGRENSTLIHERGLGASIPQAVLQPRRMLNSHSSGHHSSGHHSSHSSSGSHSSHGGHHSSGGHHTSGGGHHHSSSGSHHGGGSHNSSNHDSSHVTVGRGRHNPAYAAYGNPIDDCWMGGNQADPKSLARCATGFGRNARGGASGEIYHVTTAADDVQNPQPGMLRYGLTRTEPLWIVFDADMTFQGLDAEMITYSRKTIDGRGRNIVFQNGPCFAVEFVSDVIIESISFRNCRGRGGTIRIAVGPDGKTGGRGPINGYGVYVYQSTNIWIDHCSFGPATDTQVDIIYGSTDITISNCYFYNQDKVMLLGHSDSNTADRNMRVTVVLNKFGPNLNERMPRGRFGAFDVVNNYYPNGWGNYAIGGSANPSFTSEGNFYVASNDRNHKEVTQHNIATDNWQGWKWVSINDHFENGAFFRPSGGGGAGFARSYSLRVIPATSVPRATSMAGPL